MLIILCKSWSKEKVFSLVFFLFGKLVLDVGPCLLQCQRLHDLPQGTVKQHLRGFSQKNVGWLGLGLTYIPALECFLARGNNI